MARYIKANPKVAEYLGLTEVRNRVADGNYLLWQNDMLHFGRLTDLPDILKRIGGLCLQAHEARQEQDGTKLRKLPTATDEQFIIEREAEEEVTEESSDIETPAVEVEEETEEDE